MNEENITPKDERCFAVYMRSAFAFVGIIFALLGAVEFCVGAIAPFVLLPYPVCAICGGVLFAAGLVVFLMWADHISLSFSLASVVMPSLALFVAFGENWQIPLCATLSLAVASGVCMVFPYPVVFLVSGVAVATGGFFLFGCEWIGLALAVTCVAVFMYNFCYIVRMTNLQETENIPVTIWRSPWLAVLYFLSLSARIRLFVRTKRDKLRTYDTMVMTFEEEQYEEEERSFMSHTVGIIMPPDFPIEDMVIDYGEHREKQLAALAANPEDREAMRELIIVDVLLIEDKWKEDIMPFANEILNYAPILTERADDKLIEDIATVCKRAANKIVGKPHLELRLRNAQVAALERLEKESKYSLSFAVKERDRVAEEVRRIDEGIEQEEDKYDIRIDSVERTEKFENIADAVDAKAERETKDGQEWGRIYAFWDAKKRILREEHNIEWRDMAEVNAYIWWVKGWRLVKAVHY